MKIQQLEYVIAIAQEGSITGAAKKLYQAQPNISIALKELEKKMGIQIFWRTPNGMILTPEGEEFFMRAKKIVSDIHSLESDYTNTPAGNITFKVAATRSAYITSAIGQWINRLNSENKNYSFHFLETNTHQVIEDVGSGKIDVGVIRVPASQTNLYQQQLESKKLTEKILMEFSMRILMRKNHPLAEYDDVPYELLKNYTEVIHGDEDLNLFRKTYINPQFSADFGGKQVYVYDRGSKASFLQMIENSYMWVSPVPKPELKDGEMVIKNCSYACIQNRDIIIMKKGSEHYGLVKSCINDLIDYTKKELMD